MKLVCLSISTEIRGLFSGTCVSACVLCVLLLFFCLSPWTQQHVGMRPNTLGMDLRINLHSLTIFTLTHVREIRVLVGHE